MAQKGTQPISRKEHGLRGILHGEATLEGFTQYPQRDHREVTVYFRPQRDWSGRRIWMHVYPPVGHDYVVADALVPPFDGWKANALAWETFQIPGDLNYVLYVGVEVAHNLGSGYRLGAVDRWVPSFR